MKEILKTIAECNKMIIQALTEKEPCCNKTLTLEIDGISPECFSQKVNPKILEHFFRQ